MQTKEPSIRERKRKIEIEMNFERLQQFRPAKKEKKNHVTTFSYVLRT